MFRNIYILLFLFGWLGLIAPQSIAAIPSIDHCNIEQMQDCCDSDSSTPDKNHCTTDSGCKRCCTHNLVIASLPLLNKDFIPKTINISKKNIVDNYHHQRLPKPLKKIWHPPKIELILV